MNYKNWNYFLGVLFLVLSAAIIIGGKHYLDEETKFRQEKSLIQLASSTTKRIDTLIEEKKNATLALALAISHSGVLQPAVSDSNTAQAVLKNISKELAKNTNLVLKVKRLCCSSAVSVLVTLSVLMKIWVWK